MSDWRHGDRPGYHSEDVEAESLKQDDNGDNYIEFIWEQTMPTYEIEQYELYAHKYPGQGF